jgi:spoIIIJ-associated protein
VDNNTASQNDEVLTLEVSSEEEARRQAAAHWGIPEDQVVLNVIEEGKAFFGLFGRKMKIEARRTVPQTEESPAPAEKAEDKGADSDFAVLLKRVLAAAGLELEINVLSDGSVNLSGTDSRILLAGHHGEGLKALDYLVNLMARNNGPVPHVRIDCEGFRRKREKELERIAMDAAKEAMKTRRTVYLQPMTSWERRIVHLTLKESTNVETHSVGVEPGRKVAVRLIGSRPDRRERSEAAGRGGNGSWGRSGRSGKNHSPRRRRRPSASERRTVGTAAEQSTAAESIPHETEEQA